MPDEPADVVEAAARAIAKDFDVDPDVFIGMHGKDLWKKQWHPAARAAIEAARPMIEAEAWRPVASAPRDGTLIDLWCVNSMGEHYTTGYRFTNCMWLTELTLAPRWVDRDNDEATVEDCGWRATHWRPLPAPPSIEPRP